MNSPKNQIDRLFSENGEDKAQTGKLGIIGLIIGVFGLLFSFCCTFMAVLPGLTALVCGIIAKSNRQNFASWGIILGIITVIAAVALTVAGMR